MKAFTNARVIQEGKFMVGAAATGCVVGAVAAFLLPPLPWVTPPLSAGAQLTVRLAHGVGLGWWAGLFWALFTVLLARSQPTPPQVSCFPRLGLWAALTALVVLALGSIVKLPAKASLFGGVLTSLVATRFGLSLLPRDRR